MAELAAIEPFSTILAPTEIERRRKRRSHGTGIAIGALIILDDGSRCIFAGYDQNGNVLCYPEAE